MKKPYITIILLFVTVFVLADDQWPLPESRRDEGNSSEAWVSMTVEQAQGILASGGDPNAQNGFHDTALMWAARCTANPEVISVLLDAGADVNSGIENSRTALVWATQYNPNPTIISTLVNAGADVDVRNSHGNTLLMVAAEVGADMDVFRALLSAGTDVNARRGHDETALMYLIQYEAPPEVIGLLTAAGADVNAQDYRGKTALMWTASYQLRPNVKGHSGPEVIGALLAAGADVGIRDNIEETALMLTVKYNPNPAVIGLLLDAGADVNACGYNNQTVLMEAARGYVGPDAMRILLDHGADVNAQNGAGYTALMWAVGYNPNPAVISVLLEAGADVTLRDGNDNTVMMRAAEEMWESESDKDAQVVGLLLEAGADVSFAGGQWPLLQGILASKHETPASSELYLCERPRINGPSVVALQKVLMANGYDLGSDGADGWFGPMADRALRAYQADTNEVVTGRIDSRRIPELPEWQYRIRTGNEHLPDIVEGTSDSFNEVVPGVITGRYGNVTLRRDNSRGPETIIQVLAPDGDEVACSAPGLISQSPGGRRFVLLEADSYAGGGDEALVVVDILLEQAAEVRLATLVSGREIGRRSYFTVDELVWNNNDLWFLLGANYLGSSGHPGIDSQRQEELGSDFERDDPITIGWFGLVSEE